MGIITSALGLAGLGALGAANKNQQAKKQDQRNLEMNKELMGLQNSYNSAAADKAHERTKELYEISRQNNSMQEKVKQANEAGLSVGLLYGNGGAGGTGAGGGTGSMASTSTSASNIAAERATGMEIISAMNEQKLANAQEQKVKNETALINAQKKNIEADTEQKTATTERTKELTPFEKGLMKENITKEWIENVRKDWENLDNEKFGAMETKNELIGRELRIDKKGNFNQIQAATIAEIKARTENNKAMSELNTEKKKGYWTELLNATIHADAAKAQAAAVKLASEWTTGEYTNWRTWSDEAKGVVRSITDIIKK